MKHAPFKSKHQPIPLTEDEEAALAFAACGITGYALGDLSYSKEEPGGTIPYRTSIGFQATHLDLDFYERHYRPEALSDSQREHMRTWHPDLPTARDDE